MFLPADLFFTLPLPPGTNAALFIASLILAPRVVFVMINRSIPAFYLDVVLCNTNFIQILELNNYYC